MTINTLSINNYFECNWTKCFNQKTQKDKMDKKNRTDLHATYQQPHENIYSHHFIQHKTESASHSNETTKRNKGHPNWQRKGKMFTICR